MVAKSNVWDVIFFFQAEDGIRDIGVTGVQTCALPILLFLPPGTSRLLRVHGAYLDENEVAKIVAHIKAQGGAPVYDETITQSEEESTNGEGGSGERDELFEQALRICCEMKRASTSVLQRRLRITPMTHNFCESCNRVRLTCTGTLYMCLGQEDAADLRRVLRDPAVDDAGLRQAIREAIARKPKGHDFVIDRQHNRPALARDRKSTRLNSSH